MIFTFSFYHELVIITSIHLLESQMGRTVTSVATSATLGERVRALREHAGFQAKDLAEVVGLDPSALSNIERGKRSVKTDELARIAAALKVSPLALLDGDSLAARIAVAPRDGGEGRIDGEAYRRLLALSDLHQILAEEGIASNPRFDDAPTIDEKAWMSDATTLAEWARGKLGSLATADSRFAALSVAIEEHLGIDVLVEDYKGDGLLGAAIIDREFPLIFVNADQSTPRGLFTLAHELGHVLSREAKAMKLDRDLRGVDQSERFANSFAAAFLMPESDVRERIEMYGRDAVSVAQMVHEFGVSFQSLVYRLHNLGLVNAAGRDRLIGIGWSGLLAAAEDPAVRDRLPQAVHNSLRARMNSSPARTPPNGLLTRALDGYRRGVISVRPIAGLLGVDADELLGALSQDSAGVLSEDYSLIEGQPVEDYFDGSPA